MTHHARRGIWLLAFPVALLVGGCGAEELEAAPSVAEKGCPKADEYVGGLYDLMEEGRLESVRSFLEQDLAPDLRGDLVATLIRLVDAFAPGTFTALEGLAAPVDDATGLQGLLAEVLRFVARDGPGAPYPECLAAARRLLATCDLGAVVGLVRDALADDALLAALSQALAGLDLGALAGSVTLEADDREAIRALLRNLLVAASDPDFEVAALLDLLGAFVDLEKPPWEALAGALTTLLGPGPRLEALQALLVCWLAADPHLAVVDLLVDVLVDPDLALTDALKALAPPPAAGAEAVPLLPEALRSLALQALDFLVADRPARQSLVAVLVAMLGEETAPGLLLAVADVLEAEILGDVLRLLVAVATKECTP